jgi:dihydrodipicolinate synthase/N-acetylneuraminate lyase
LIAQINCARLYAKEAAYMLKDNNFKGVVPPLVTLLTPDEEIDQQGTRKLIEHVISGGVHGIFLLGTTGEGMRITDKESQKAIEIAIDQVNGRATVMVNCSDFGTRRALERIRVAERLGADAAVVTISYYLPGFSQEEMARHYKQLAAESKIPLFIYNLPQGDRATIELDTVDELSEVENIAGIKDSSQDEEPLKKLIQRFEDRDHFRVFVGTEVLMVKCLISGAHGCVPSIGNVRPDLCVSLYEAIQNRDLHRVKILEKEMMDTRARVYTRGKSWLSYISGIKAALSQLGISGKTVTQPFEK